MKGKLTYFSPLKRPVTSLGDGRRFSKFSAIPRLLRYFLDFRSKRRTDLRVVASLRNQLNSRSSRQIDRGWIGNDQVRAASAALSDSLWKRLGWQVEKLSGDDPMGLLLFSEDDLKVLEIHIDLEDWLGKKMDPQFFNGPFTGFSFRQAVEWLATARRG